MLKKFARIVLVSVLYYGWHIPFDMTPALAQNVIAAERVSFEGPGGNVGAMRETTKITKVEVNNAGIVITADKLALPITRGGSGWPDTCTPFDNCEEPGIGMGALQYSIGFVLPVNGQLYGSAPIETWYGRENGGTGTLQDQSVTCANGTGQIQCNIFYDGRWPNLRQVHPQPGDEIGVFVVAGDARNNYVPLQERSNIVTFKLPAPGQTTTVEYSAQGGGESVAQTLASERSKYGATITSAQGAAILNAVAWAHRAEGVALLGKSGGSHCTQPNTGTAISCDYLIVNRGGTWFGQDVLVAAPADGEGPSQGGPASDVTFPDNMQDMINSGARSVVQAVDPGGITPPPPPSGGGVSQADFDALKAQVASVQAQAQAAQQAADAAEAQASQVSGALSDQVNAINGAISNLGTRIDGLGFTGCKASINLGATRISIHCELTK